MSPYREPGVTTPEEPLKTGDFRSAMFWDYVIAKGVMGLTRHDWGQLSPYLPPTARTILAHFLDSVERQSKWIVERTAAMRDEAERIALIGETMKRAGLRSYTDEKGRIFVAGDP